MYSFSVHAMMNEQVNRAQVLSKEIHEVGDQKDLPKNYKHIPVVEQINHYRSIFPDPSHGEEFTMATHIPGLLGIFANGVALVHDFVMRGNNKLNEKKAIERLERFYAIAVQLNAQQKLNASDFIVLNIALAKIIDGYKNVSVKKGPAASFDIDNVALDYFTPERYKDFCTLLLTRHYDFNAIPMVLYKKPGSKQGISINTFVNQSMNYGLRGNILLFDIDSMPYTPDVERNKYGSKKDPHYSYFNSTTRVLTHDLAHYVE